MKTKNFFQFNPSQNFIRKNRQGIILAFFLLTMVPLFSQDIGLDARIDLIDKRLEAVRLQGVPLSDPVTISLHGSIQEFVSFLAESTKLNISINPEIQKQISVTFTDAKVKDILLYCCEEYDMDLKFTGNIIRMVEYKKPVKQIVVKEPLLEFNATSNKVTMQLEGDTLQKVASKLSKLTGQNIVVSTEIRTFPMYGYINEVPLEQALKQLTESNNLKLEKKDNFFIIKKLNQNQIAQNDNQNNRSSNRRNGQGEGQNSGVLDVKRAGNNQVNIQANNVPVLDIIQEVAFQLNAAYFLLPETQFASRGNNGSNQRNNVSAVGAEIISIQIENASFKEVLDQLFQNSTYAFTEEAGLFIIGRRTTEGFRTTKIVQLEYRSARGIVNHIPKEMLQNVSLDTIMEYNSLILTGSEKHIGEVQDFVKSIDRLVPVVMIELIIIDVQTNKLQDIGIMAGVKPGGQETGGTVISGDQEGGINFSFSPDAINDLLELLAGRSIINLGKVSSDFYLSLRAVQENGYIDIKSTPKLSTLNSHPANLSIGETRYYQEQQVNFPGNDRPIPVQANVFRSVEANLDIQINPIVSGDEQVTLEISFEQSEFLESPTIAAPPPQVSRRFKSMVRVKNSEMVVLGGLERDAKSFRKRGVPILSRIPLLGWLFGGKRKTKNKSKLLIFIKPIVIN